MHVVVCMWGHLSHTMLFDGRRGSLYGRLCWLRSIIVDSLVLWYYAWLVMGCWRMLSSSMLWLWWSLSLSSSSSSRLTSTYLLVGVWSPRRVDFATLSNYTLAGAKVTLAFGISLDRIVASWTTANFGDIPAVVTSVAQWASWYAAGPTTGSAIWGVTTSSRCGCGLWSLTGVWTGGTVTSLRV